MAKKKGQGKDKPTAKPKSLRKQLRRAESDLAKATAKRDKAQARVDAMSIIADEIRAQLADIDKAAAKSGDGKDPASSGQSTSEPAPKRSAGARARADVSKATPTRKASARKAAAASSRSATTTRSNGKRSAPGQRKGPPKS